jgi:hypothetical protein
LDDTSGDEATNIPPAKARKNWKDLDTKPGSIDSIFSDDEIIPRPRKSKVVNDSDDDLGSGWQEYFDTHPGSSKSKNPEKGSTPVHPEWTQSDIPLKCPDEDCDEDVIDNPSPLLIALFCDRAKIICRQGIEALNVYKINFRICVQIKGERADDDRRRRAEKHGLVNVDFQKLANRVWGLKDTIDPMMSSPAARSKTFIWTNLCDDLKYHKYSVARLNKGKDVPRKIVATARPGQ